VHRAEVGTRITELVKSQFPHVPVLTRAVDRHHSIELIHAGADLQVRETFESAIVLGASALERLGASQADIAQIEARIRTKTTRSDWSSNWRVASTQARHCSTGTWHLRAIRTLVPVPGARAG
jgi:hypothetical protein